MKTRMKTMRFRRIVIAGLLAISLAPFASGNTVSAMHDHPHPLSDSIFDPHLDLLTP